MKKYIALLLILLLSITTQAFAITKNNSLADDEKTEVTEKNIGTDVNEVTMENGLQQTNYKLREKLELNWPGELQINLDEEDSSINDKLCWVCTKSITNKDPNFYVCIDGYWSKYCVIP
ncbi:hypothetical protein [Cytobacillus sp.]|uniref:hypothetical protein n=1 Tax=Cytobacillus sp. TaxID=2675269 RepID=UPI0028BEBF5D|nr:hypothetical protein [Cytobacillus sp.]